MSKVRVFIPPADISDNIKVVDRSVVHKLKDVLRLLEGADVYVFDGQGSEWVYRISGVSKSCVSLKREGLSRSQAAPATKISLVFPLLREDKLDLILQKGTELGADKFIPFTCRRGLSRKVDARHLERWQKIIIEAARQSERLWLPAVSPALPFADVLKYDCALKLEASFDGNKINKSSFPPSCFEVLLIVGPEGGFTPEEKDAFGEHGYRSINLGCNILRVETAAVFGVGLINYFVKTGHFSHNG